MSWARLGQVGWREVGRVIPKLELLGIWRMVHGAEQIKVLLISVSEYIRIYNDAVD